MLVQDPADNASRPSSPRGRCSPAVAAALTFAAVLVLVLRHDYWFWDTPYPLLFGFLPVGIWWQLVVSLLAAVLMWLMVRFAWPQDVEDEALDAERGRLETDSTAQQESRA